MMARRACFLIILTLTFLHSGCNGRSTVSSGEEWETTGPIGTNIGSNPANARIAIEAGDNAIVVWDRGDGSVWYNRYSETTGWGTADVVPGSVNGSMSRIASDRHGHVVAVWHSTDGNISTIRGNRYMAGAGWGDAELVFTDNAWDIRNLEIAADTHGNVMVVWQQGGILGTNRYDSANGWGTPSLIYEFDEFMSEPQIAVDDDGGALAVWHHVNNYGYVAIKSKRYTTSQGWDNANTVLADPNSVGPPQIAMNGSGQAIAVWDAYDNTSLSYNVWARRFIPGTGWEAATMISDDGKATSFHVAIDDNGNGVAIWRESVGLDNTNVRANYYAAGVGWGTAVVIGRADPGWAVPSQVAMDSKGNAFAIWAQNPGGHWQARASRFEKGVGWGSAATLDTQVAGAVPYPRIAVTDSGTAVAVWEHAEDSGPFGIWTSRYHEYPP